MHFRKRCEGGWKGAGPEAGTSEDGGAIAESKDEQWRVEGERGQGTWLLAR